MKKFYPAIFEPEDIGYSIFIPDIPGCMTQGDSIEESLEMAQEAIGIMLEDIPEEKYPIPSKPQDIKIEGNQFIMMVSFDSTAYKEKYDSVPVEKMVSIPHWLDVMATDQKLDLSLLFQNALRKQLGLSPL